MATNVLPQLSVSGKGVGSGEPRTLQLPPLSVSHTRSRPEGKASPPPSRFVGNAAGRRVGGKHKQQKRTLVKDVNPASYRHSLFHNICTEMLEMGFHKSFTELFDLVQQQKIEHEVAGPGAILLEPLIHCDHAKLEYLRVQLTTAEDAERRGSPEAVYIALKSLAQYFDRNQGTWLSFHFYQRALEVAQEIEGDSQRSEGEGQCSVGLALERKGELLRAARHFEAYRDLAHKWNWCSDSGESVYEIACEHLRRVYTSMAKNVEVESTEEAISLLKKAHEMARESKHSVQEGLACYRLGLAHQLSGDLETAMQYYRKYLEWCRYHKHHEGAGNAHEALAKCHERKGELESAVEHLENYVKVAENAGVQAVAKACSEIGTMYNTLGDYEKAVKFFGRCYDLCSQLNDPTALHKARVQYGIAQSHLLFKDYTTTVCTTTSSYELEQLIAWKDSRTPIDDVKQREEKDGEEEENEEKKDGGGNGRNTNDKEHQLDSRLLQGEIASNGTDEKLSKDCINIESEGKVDNN